MDAIQVYNKQGDIVAWATRDLATGEVTLCTQCNNSRRTENTLGEEAWDAVCNVLEQLQEAIDGRAR